MKKRGFALLALLVVVAIVGLLVLPFAPPARAAEYQRLILTGQTSAAYTNTQVLYNAKLLSIRAVNRAGAACTNTIAISQVTADYLTNSVAAFTTPTSGSADLANSNLYQLRNDVLGVSATSNFLVEVILDNRGR
jgi:type II secretory pathway pseudopilin PulG